MVAAAHAAATPACAAKRGCSRASRRGAPSASRPAVRIHVRRKGGTRRTIPNPWSLIVQLLEEVFGAQREFDVVVREARRIGARVEAVIAHFPAHRGALGDEQPRARSEADRG